MWWEPNRPWNLKYWIKLSGRMSNFGYLFAWNLCKWAVLGVGGGGGKGKTRLKIPRWLELTFQELDNCEWADDAAHRQVDSSRVKQVKIDRNTWLMAVLSVNPSGDGTHLNSRAIIVNGTRQKNKWVINSVTGPASVDFRLEFRWNFRFQSTMEMRRKPLLSSAKAWHIFN